MSSHAITWGWDVKLPAAQKIVLLFLADVADLYGRCAVSVIQIAEQCGLNIRDVEEYLSELYNKGVIVYLPQTKPSREFDSWLEINLNLVRSPNSFNFGAVRSIKNGTN